MWNTSERERAMKAKRNERAASLVIHGPGRMTARGRRKIASWLRMHANMLLKEGNNYTEGRFTGSYFRV